LDILRSGIEVIQLFPNWGNGRDVTQLWKDVYQARATRMQREAETTAKSTAKN
jgi:hypothetical protein